MSTQTWFRRAVRAALWLVLALVVVTLAVVWLAGTDWGRARLARVLASQVAGVVDGTLSIGRLDGTVISGLTLHDVRVTRDGRDVLSVRRIDGTYRVRNLWADAVVVDTLVLTGVEMTVREEPDGWHVDGLAVPAANPDAAPGTGTVHLPHVEIVGGRAAIRPIGRAYDLVDVVAEADVLIADDIIVDLTRFAGREAQGGLVVSSLITRVVVADAGTVLEPLVVQTGHSQATGRLAIAADGSLQADVRSDRLVLPELAHYVPALTGIDLSPAVTLAFAGPLDALRVTGPVVDPVAGSADVDVVMDLADPRFAVRGHAELTRLDVAPWAVRPDLPTRLTGRVQFDLQDAAAAEGLVGTFDATLSRSIYERYEIDHARVTGTLGTDAVRARVNAAAYGASSTGTLVYAFDTEIARITGRLSDGNAARLPAFLELPPLDSRVAGTYTLVARGPDDWRLESVLDASELEGTTIDAGTVVDLALHNDVVTYRVDGRMQRVDPRRLAPKLLDTPPADEAWGFEHATLSGAITVAGTGRVDADLTDHAVTVAGRIDADVDEARLRGVDVAVTLGERRLTLQASGTVFGTWDVIDIDSDGRFDVEVDVADVLADWSPAFADGRLDLTVGAGRVQGLMLSSVRMQATAADGLITITDSRSTGPGVTLDVSGMLALGDDGRSDLRYRLDIADLSRLPAEWLATPAAGHLQTEGRVTGPFLDPTLRGRFTAGALETSDAAVVSLEGEYTVRVPEFLMDRMTGDARAEAAFIRTAGGTIPAAEVVATFASTTGDVTATLRFADATLDVTATVSLDDPVEGVDAEAITVMTRAIRVQLPGEVWVQPDASNGSLRLSSTTVAVEGLVLRNGDSAVTLAGQLPLSADAGLAGDMRVDVTGTEVAGWLAAWLGEERVRGVLSGTAVVTGTVDAPVVEATFTLADGSADDVPFRSVHGTAGLAGTRATLDVQLDAGERGTATIRGTVPVDPDAEGMDVVIRAGLADVGVVAPALPYIARASGVADVDLTVTGSQASPSVNGRATLRDVQFDVPETGVSYRRLNTDMRVADSVLTVQQFSVEDPDGHVLRVTGRLDVLARGGDAEVDLRIVAREFRMLGNRFGDLSVNLNLTAVGTVLAPQVIGSVRVERGRFEVDALLQQFVSTVAGPAGPEHAAPVPPSVFSDAALSIDVILPDNVVVRGRGLQTDDGPIGLGDVNLTLGGTLQVVKARGGEAALIGEVSAVRGTYEFQGRRFAIQRGSRLQFRGDDYTNPALDILATREVSGVTVRAKIQGTAMVPTLTLSSEPSLEEGDILALVVFNKPINQLGQGERVSLAARAGSLAAGAVVGPIADSVARALDLDVFEIQTGEAGTIGATVTVGRQVSDRLFVGFRHEFGGDGANRLTFEYRLTEFLRILTSVAPGGQVSNRTARTETAGIDLIVVVRR